MRASTRYSPEVREQAVRLDRRAGEAFALDLGVWRRERATERPEHGVGLDLRLSW